VALMLSALPPARPLTSWYQFTLLGEQGHQNISSLSRAISQKVGGLGNQTCNPSGSETIPYPLAHPCYIPKNSANGASKSHLTSLKKVSLFERISVGEFL